MPKGDTSGSWLGSDRSPQITVPAVSCAYADPELRAQNEAANKHTEELEAEETNIFTMSALTALSLLCSSVEDLVRITGDVPPTPPASTPITPVLTLMQAGKENRVRHNKDSIKAKLVKEPSGEDDEEEEQEDEEGVLVPVKKTPIGSPEAGPLEGFQIIDSGIEPLSVQQSTIARKFYSKRPPPISLEEYLQRLHRFCPMSTAVYLATSLYIHRLALVERVITVTARNVHRLLLAGLRVAMKALEDLSYAHRRFAKVGGVSETELGRLEISFCFLTDFELKVDKEMLHQQAMMLKEGMSFHAMPNSFRMALPILTQKSPSLIKGGMPTKVTEVNLQATW